LLSILTDHCISFPRPCRLYRLFPGGDANFVSHEALVKAIQRVWRARIQGCKEHCAVLLHTSANMLMGGSGLKPVAMKILLQCPSSSPREQIGPATTLCTLRSKIFDTAKAAMNVYIFFNMRRLRKQVAEKEASYRLNRLKKAAVKAMNVFLDDCRDEIDEAQRVLGKDASLSQCNHRGALHSTPWACRVPTR
jgi:hypothetical protein